MVSLGVHRNVGPIPAGGLLFRLCFCPFNFLNFIKPPFQADTHVAKVPQRCFKAIKTGAASLILGLGLC